MPTAVAKLRLPRNMQEWRVASTHQRRVALAWGLPGWRGPVPAGLDAHTRPLRSPWAFVAAVGTLLTLVEWAVAHGWLL